MSRRRKVLVGVAVSLALAISLIGLYTRFEYTLVPELRERFAGAETKDGVALGELLFDTRGCSGCHTLGALSASRFGPDLTEIASRASASDIRTSILDPDAQIAGSCPDGPCVAGLMPAFGDILTDRETEALIAFLLAYAQQATK